MKDKELDVVMRGQGALATVFAIVLLIFGLLGVLSYLGETAVLAIIVLLVFICSLIGIPLAARRFRRTTFTWNEKQGTISTFDSFFLNRLIPVERVDSVNILVGQLWFWQAAWLCLAVKRKNYLVILGETTLWAATRAQLADIYKNDGRRLAERFGCPCASISTPNPI